MTGYELIYIIAELICFLAMDYLCVFLFLPGWFSLRSSNWRLHLGGSDGSSKLHIYYHCYVSHVGGANGLLSPYMFLGNLHVLS